jgi:hypothetical protein
MINALQALGDAFVLRAQPRLQLSDIGDLQIDAHACLFDTGASPTPSSLAGPPPAALVDLTWVSPSRFQPPRAT